jgi:ADP-ribose pyrophosphatase
VRQGPGRILEIIAGMFDKAEAPQETMRREILEETRHEVCNLQHVSTFYLTPGGSSKRIFLYYGEVAVNDRREPGGGLADEKEDIEIAVDDAFAAVDQDAIVDAKTLIALMWFRNRRLQT